MSSRLGGVFSLSRFRRGQEHSGSAVAALQSITFYKGCLQRSDFAAVGNYPRWFGRQRRRPAPRRVKQPRTNCPLSGPYRHRKRRARIRYATGEFELFAERKSTRALTRCHPWTTRSPFTINVISRSAIIRPSALRHCGQHPFSQHLRQHEVSSLHSPGCHLAGPNPRPARI